MNLFDNAKKTSPAKAKKEDNRLTVIVKESEIKGFGKKVKLLNDLRTEVKAKSAELAMIDADINTVARQKYISLYREHGKNVGMFNIVTEDGQKFAVTPADAYKAVNEEKYTELVEEYGSDVVEHEVEYSFNNKVLAKHMELISKLIMESDMPDEDKQDLLVRKDKYAVKKGTINEMAAYGDKMDRLFEDIQPTVQIKF